MADERKMISWNRPMLKRFKRAYAEAQKHGVGPDDTFRFEGNEFVLSYAKYLIEYLDKSLPP